MSTTISSDFEWTRGYSKAANQVGAYSFSCGEIRQTGRGKERFRPLATEGLYLRFAALDGSPESCVAFASNWGLLTKPASLTKPPSEPLELWRREIRRIKIFSRMLPNVVKLANSRGTYAIVGSLNVLLVPGGSDPDAKPALVLEPQTLLQAMNLQLALWVAGGGTLAVCQQCRQPFQAGIGGKRRSIAKYCSVACKNRHHYEQRAGK